MTTATHSTSEEGGCPPLYATPLPPDVPGAWFDQAAVDRVVRALRALRHTKGRWADQPFELEPWQLKYVVGPIFGWKHPDGRRIIRTAWIEIPRKAGKSTLASGLALVLLCADREQGAEVYSAAASRDQARIVFDAAKRMAARSPALRGKLKLLSSAILAPKTGGVYRVLSNLAEVAHGLNVHGAIVDEVHVHKSRDLIDAIETGTGAREQPLVIFITTADDGDTASIYNEKHEYTIKLAKRIATDPTFYGVIWAAPPPDKEGKPDPFAESTWRAAHPGLGSTVSLEYFQKEATRAKETPTYFATFCRLMLNRRVRPESRWLALDKWDASAGLLRESELEGRDCYGGLDLGSSIDLAALGLVFPMGAEYRALMRFWLPEENLAARVVKDRVPYDVWASQGWITLTPGNVIDYAYIRAELKALGARYHIREVAYDRWGATQLSQDLEADGFTVIPMGQGFASMSPPTKELIALVLKRLLVHGGNPVLRWMADNMVVRQDAAGNLKPDKEKSREKIDGMIALIEALDRAIRHKPARKSAYEDHGVMAV